MSLSLPIPPHLRASLADDPFYAVCCIKHPECTQKIQWHHNLIYANKRQNRKFCILPVCDWIHDREKRKDIKEKLNKIMWARATEEDKKYYDRIKQ